MTAGSKYAAGRPAPAGTDATSHVVALLEAATTDVNVLICSDSTAAFTTSWPYLLAGKLAADYPAWSVTQQRIDSAGAIDTWNAAPYIIQTGTGPRTLTIWNASVAGWCAMMLFGSNRWTNLIAGTVRQDLVILAHAHNETAIVDPTWTGGFANGVNQSPDTFRARMASMVGLIRQVQPAARVLVLASNPSTGSEETNQLRRARLLADVASITGSSYADIGPAFRAVPNWGTRLMTDAVHPNSAGQEVYAETVHDLFTGYDGPAPDGLQPSPLDVQSTNLLTNPGLVQTVPGTVDSWTAINVTPSQNVTYYESAKGYSTQLDAAAAGTSYLTQTVATGAALAPILGQWVTLGVRMRIPELGQTGVTQGVATGSAYLGTVDYTMFAPQFQNIPRDGWCWWVISGKVPLTCTTLTARIYCAYASYAAARVQVDRAVLVRGITLRDDPR